MRCLVSGCSGFVGKVVCAQLAEKGHEVWGLSRSPEKARALVPELQECFAWSATGLIPPEAFVRVDAVIHLAGSNIADGRWTKSRKSEIYNSRVQSTQNLVDTIERLNPKPKVFISTSAIGFYGYPTEELTEKAANGVDFLAGVCRDWEREAEKLTDVRTVIFRVGVVYGTNGGAMKKMLPIFRMGLGGPMGDGKQWQSWIHVEDLATLYVRAAEYDTFSGTYNAVAPNNVTNHEFTQSLGAAVKKPAVLRLPAFFLKLLLGEMSLLMLSSQRVVPARLKEAEFPFRFPDIKDALKHIVSSR